MARGCLLQLWHAGKLGSRDEMGLPFPFFLVDSFQASGLENGEPLRELKRLGRYPMIQFQKGEGSEGGGMNTLHYPI